MSAVRTKLVQRHLARVADRVGAPARPRPGGEGAATARGYSFGAGASGGLTGGGDFLILDAENRTGVTVEQL